MWRSGRSISTRLTTSIGCIKRVRRTCVTSSPRTRPEWTARLEDPPNRAILNSRRVELFAGGHGAPTATGRRRRGSMSSVGMRRPGTCLVRSSCGEDESPTANQASGPSKARGVCAPGHGHGPACSAHGISARSVTFRRRGRSISSASSTRTSHRGPCITLFVRRSRAMTGLPGGAPP
jgi:hypothetical protein